MTSSPNSPATGPIEFRTTAWSVLLAQGDPVSRDGAFEHLFRAYWRPVYALYRRAYQVPPEQAADLTQGLFLRLIQGLSLKADRSRGRFRAFLKVAARSHMLDQKTRRAADGAFPPPHWAAMVRIEMADGDRDYDPIDEAADPDAAFDREFAHALVAQAFAAFEEDCRRRGTERWPPLIRLRYLDPPTDQTRGRVEAIAQQVGLEPAQVSRLLYKAKQAFRRHLLAEVRGTLPPSEASDPAALDEEVAALLAAL